MQRQQHDNAQITHLHLAISAANDHHHLQQHQYDTHHCSDSLRRQSFDRDISAAVHLHQLAAVVTALASVNPSLPEDGDWTRPDADPRGTHQYDDDDALSCTDLVGTCSLGGTLIQTSCDGHTAIHRHKSYPG